MRILFVLKQREGYWGPATGSDLSSGLKNSVRFIVDMLNDMGYAAAMVQVADNNKIDAAIAAFKPDLVILEALWVVPEKLDVLIPKWPKVKFAIRNHSDVPFIANEGIATSWLAGYWKRGLFVLSNDPIAVRDLAAIAWSYGGQEFYDRNGYAPNYYPLGDSPPEPVTHTGDNTFEIGCFGSIRPLKNQLLQAVAAIQFCQQTRRHLRFHINASRVEQVGEPILRNLRGLFSNASNAELVEHPWLDHDPFLDVLKTIDFQMCVSLSETFCIVASDGVGIGLPTIGSKEIPWMEGFDIADPANSVEMVWRLMQAEQFKREWCRRQWQNLKAYDKKTQDAWTVTLKLFQ